MVDKFAYSLTNGVSVSGWDHSGSYIVLWVGGCGLVLIGYVCDNGFLIGFRRLFRAHIASHVIFSSCVLHIIVHHSFLNGSCNVVNPRRIREGYGSRSVCVSYRTTGYIYLIYTLKIGCH